MDGGTGAEQSAIADLERLGAHEAVAALKAENEAERARNAIVTVEPENVDVVRVFMRMRTQWQLVPHQIGHVSILRHTGLKYEALPVVTGALGIPLDGELLDDLRFMEVTALNIYGDRETRAARALQRPR